MNLTIQKVKKWLMIIGIILPILLLQLAISMSLEKTFVNALIKEREETLSMFTTDFKETISETQNFNVKLNQLDDIEDSLDRLQAQKGYEIIDSLNSNNTQEQRQIISNLLKSGDLSFDRSKEYLYFINHNPSKNRVLIFKVGISDLVNQSLNIGTDNVDIGIFVDGMTIFKTEHFISFDEINNLNAEIKEANGEKYLVLYNKMQNINAEVNLTYNLTEDLKEINVITIRYSFIMMLVLTVMGYVYYKIGRLGKDEIGKMLLNLRVLEESLKKHKLEVLELEDLDFPLQNEIKHFSTMGRKLVKTIDELENQIKSSKIENEQIIIEQKILKETLKTIERDKEIGQKIRDEFIDFVDQILITIDENLKIVNVNKVYLKKMGFSREDVLGCSIIDFILENTDSELINNLSKPSNDLIFLNLKHKSDNESISDFVSLKRIEWDENQIMLIGKSIHEEITLQSRILRKNRELEYINQINTSLISNWGIDELLENIIRRIDYLFNVEFGTIYIKDDEQKWLLKAAATTLTDEEDLFLSQFESYFPMDNTDLKVYDLTNDLNVESPLTEKASILILAPLEVEQELIAVMMIGLKSKMKSSDLNILRMFKNQASIVIQRAILYDKLRKQYFNTIEALVNVIEAKDKYTEGHSRRVSRFSVEIATEIGYSNEEIEKIEISGLLHDVGKVGINQMILNKIGKLTKEEYEIIKEHPEKGVQILQSIKLDRSIMDGIHYHHVRYDLKGYPKNHGLSNLPAYAAIIGVADAFDAMTSARSYTKPRSIDAAMQEIKDCIGSQFDPEIVSALNEVITHNQERIQTIIDDIRS